MSIPLVSHVRRRASGLMFIGLATLTVGCDLPAWWVSAGPTAPPVTTPQPTTTVAPTSTLVSTTGVPSITTTTFPVQPTTTLTPPTVPPTTTAPTTTVPATPFPADAAAKLNLCGAGPGSTPTPGPVVAPAGAVSISPGSDPTTVTAGRPGGTTFWFAPGTHRPSAAIVAQTGDVFVGAPGAVLDGGYSGIAAFTGGGSDVVIRGLIIERFGTATGHGWVNGAAVNRSVAAGWRVENNVIRLNDGNALFLGDRSVTTGNCFDRNGQTGLSAPAQRRNGVYVSLAGLVVRGNEIRGNNRNNLEAAGGCTGCTGGMKLWQTESATVTGNKVVSNHGVGIWLDNNNADSLISDNFVADNDREGIMVETSFNARIINNVVNANAVVDGSSRTDSFPVAGIFVSNSGGSTRVPGPVGIEVSGNHLGDNWNGVVVFWNADRYCGSASDTSVGHCTLGGPTLDQCAALAQKPVSVDGLLSECHWGVSGVSVTNNRFEISAAMRLGCGTRCGRNGLIASVAPVTNTFRFADGRLITFANPLDRNLARSRVVDPARNRFSGNVYSGSWFFDLASPGSKISLAQWRQSGQDLA